DIGAEDAAQAGIVRSFLRPVESALLRIDCDSDAPARLVSPITAAAGLDQRLDLRAIEIGAHHAHAFAVAPIELAALPIEMELLGRMRAAGWDDGLAVAAIEIGALD